MIAVFFANVKNGLLQVPFLETQEKILKINENYSYLPIDKSKKLCYILLVNKNHPHLGGDIWRLPQKTSKSATPFFPTCSTPTITRRQKPFTLI